MRKESLKTLIKTVTKKGESKGLTFNPTLEECEYLYSKNIAIMKSRTLRNYSLLDENLVMWDTSDFVLDK